jgi:hypothetical protein
MSGVQIVLDLLLDNAALLELVDEGQIMAGDLPIGTALPAISVTLISGVDLNELDPDPNTTRFVTDRVQVTILAANYPQKSSILTAVRRAVADKAPTISGLTGISVHLDGTGPDFADDETNIRFATQDFRVKYNEER